LPRNNGFPPSNGGSGRGLNGPIPKDSKRLTVLSKSLTTTPTCSNLFEKRVFTVISVPPY
jgi:hypothetical protein